MLSSPYPLILVSHFYSGYRRVVVSWETASSNYRCLLYITHISCQDILSVFLHLKGLILLWITSNLLCSLFWIYSLEYIPSASPSNTFFQFADLVSGFLSWVYLSLCVPKLSPPAWSSFSGILAVLQIQPSGWLPCLFYNRFQKGDTQKAMKASLYLLQNAKDCWVRAWTQRWACLYHCLVKHCATSGGSQLVHWHLRTGIKQEFSLNLVSGDSKWMGGLGIGLEASPQGKGMTMLGVSHWPTGDLRRLYKAKSIPGRW